MLLKKEECYLLEKLRTIVLYEADYNHENKRLGRDAMNMALAQNKIADEQFSRPGRSAQENAVCKRLMFDYCRTRKQPFGICACDLKSCYDRIVHTAASIALQRIGIPRGKLIGMFGAVQKLVHRIRTLYGDSKGTYGGENKSKRYSRPPQGTGQGNGAAPTIWAVLSSTIFEILHAEGYGTSFMFALSRGLFQLCGFSYVDDCDLLHIGDDVIVVAAQLQKMLSMWDELMEVNGGAIAPDKCWWYLAEFVWKEGQWKMNDAGEAVDLQVRDKDGKVWSLTYLSVSAAREMLGIRLAPDGNQDAELVAMQEKVRRWTDHIIQGGLDWGTTWVALKTTISKSLGYALPATSFSKQQIKSITTPLYAVALPRSGFVRTFPRDVLHGPISCQGLGLTHMYDEQYL